ncbi:MAG: hypothetical protein J5818_03950 [Eggerthellaceae bacterium]|nr:hypothetical protein [Eggerthellaceae bacterium]
MRSTDERIVAVQVRSRALQRHRNQRRNVVVTALSAVVSAAAIIGCAFTIPGVLGTASVVPEGTSGAFGSIVASGGMLGFIFIGVLAFCLGVAVTLLCVKLREYSQDETDDFGDVGDTAKDGLR